MTENAETAETPGVERAYAGAEVPLPEGVLACPTGCGVDYLHLLRVEVDQGPEGLTYAGDPAHPGLPAPSGGHGSARGSTVRTWFACECGVRFAWTVAFAKGRSYAFVDALATPAPEQLERELWRS